MSDSLISSEVLASRMDDPGLVVLDASWYLAADGRDPWKEYLAAHIPGARFFDIEAASDPSTELPHMFPSPEALAAYARTLGIGPASDVVAYDGSGVNLSAARVWWMFRTIGFERVAVLDGGLGAWRAEGRPVDHGQRSIEPAPESIPVRLAAGRLRDLAAVEDIVQSGSEVIVDARSAGRFRGEEPEPRPGVLRGHIPRSRNLPYRSLVGAEGRLRPEEELRRLFAEAGVALDRPITATCGSGLSACAVLLALDRLGVTETALYDGSWAEYGASTTTTKATGADPVG